MSRSSAPACSARAPRASATSAAPPRSSVPRRRPPSPRACPCRARGILEWTRRRIGGEWPPSGLRWTRRPSSPGRSEPGRGIIRAMTPFPLALDGVRVIDLSRVIAGPWCGALLSDLGADVIKVEDTGAGDESRTWPPHKDGEAAAYLLFNRNKRAMTLDLKTPEGVEVVKALTRNADVGTENFRTGTMEGFGLGYDTLNAENPRLIYCSVSAFGRTGPRKDSPGYEALM